MFKKMIKKNAGFTLVEMMVVVIIIGVLSTLVIISLDTTKATARNNRRLADVKQLQLALKMYYNDNGSYPTAITAGASIARNGINYLLRVPQNPMPSNDGTCSPNQDYQYKQLEGGQRYSLTFCLGDVTDDLSAGPKTATANGILDCPSGYIPIPGSAIFETNDFCIMKYEAKCAAANAPGVGLPASPVNNGTYNNTSSPCTCASPGCTNANDKIPVSTVIGAPIGNISQATAKLYCQNIGGHLMTNAEWMTIARNIEQVPANWDTGTIGTGYISKGNFGSGPAMDGSATYGQGGGNFLYKRDLTLANGETIKDLSANVAEWLDNQCTVAAAAPGVYQGGAAYNWHTTSNVLDDERIIAGPSNRSWGSPNGMGGYVGCTTGNAFLRGGAANSPSPQIGIYNLDLTNTTSVTNSLWGFRCVK